MQMNDQQIAQAYHQGMPVEAIAHMVNTPTHDASAFIRGILSLE